MSTSRQIVKRDQRARAVKLLLIAGAAIATTLSAGAQNAPPVTAPLSGVRVTGRGPMVIEGIDEAGQLRILVNKSAVLATSRPFKRINVAQPEVADINVISPTSVLVTAKKAGSTQLIIWDDSDRSQIVDVVAHLDVAALQEQLKTILPASKIDVTVANGSIVLRGRVANLITADQAAQLAGPYGKVLNFLEIAGGQQVMLQVRFAEVSRSAVSSLGVNFGFSDGRTFGGSNIGQVSPLSATDGFADLAAGVPNPAVTLFGKAAVGQASFAYFLNALRQNNLLRILAEPNLTAISGQEASFLAGGSFPIPISQGSGGGSGGGAAITIEFKDFGVKLNFVPVVLGDGRIRLKVAPEVSDLDFTTAVRFNGFVVPGLTQRKVNTTVELCEGQTFAIAGLLNNSITANKDVTPLLGDLPILGALFRSVRYQRKETELVVLVTPRLVEAMNPAQVPALPGEKWRSPDENELFFKQDLGGPAADTRRLPTTAPCAGPAPRFYGAYGFAPVGATGK